MNYDLAAWGADLTPDRPAIWFNGRWYSFLDLNERATRLANRLAVAGVGLGARVGIVAANHLAHFDLLFAAPKLGFVFVPFNARHSAAELAEAASIVKPAMVLFDARCAEATAQAFTCTQMSLDEYRGWVADASRRRLPSPSLTPDSAQMMLFTGGSTGAAKAALLPYRQILANAQATAMGWELGPEDCSIQATPCFHAGINVLATPLLTIGGRIVLMSQFDPAEYLRLATRCGATTLFMVPSMYQTLIAHPDFERTDLRRVRMAITGGAACPAAVVQGLRARSIPFRQGYGMTEVGVNCFAMPIDEAGRHPDSVGYPLSHVRAEIRRPDGSVCAADEVGELHLSGEGLCGGYFNAPEAWSEACHAGWFATGDLATCDADGRYSIRGRRKDMFISGGENVFPGEVEKALAACKGVRECMVLSIPDVTWGEAGLAAVVMELGWERSAERLREDLRSKLAAYKMPAVILFLDTLPRTSVGKPDSAALRRLLEAEPE